MNHSAPLAKGKLTRISLGSSTTLALNEASNVSTLRKTNPLFRAMRDLSRAHISLTSLGVIQVAPPFQFAQALLAPMKASALSLPSPLVPSRLQWQTSFPSKIFLLVSSHIRALPWRYYTSRPSAFTSIGVSSSMSCTMTAPPLSSNKVSVLTFL